MKKQALGNLIDVYTPSSSFSPFPCCKSTHMCTIIMLGFPAPFIPILTKNILIIAWTTHIRDREKSLHTLE